MNDTYPVFLKLAGRDVVVVGGGPVAARRIARLVECGARVRVVSPEVVGEIKALEGVGKISWRCGSFRPADLDGAFLVLLATGDRRIAEAVRSLADERGFLLNAAEDERFSDFHVPAVIDDDPVKVAISTGGLSPSAAAGMRAQLQAWLAANRPRVRQAVSAGRRGRRQSPGARAPRSAAVPGWVHLVGAGPGDPHLITVRGRDLLTSADVVFYDRLVSDTILAVIPSGTERVYVGKEVGCAHRANICELLVEAARQERAVVRLKGGDPLIFARGGEEMLALRQAGIPFEVVPGVSALNAVGAAVHIPLTFRGIASEVVLRSGHRLERQPNATPDHETPHEDGPRSRAETTYVYFMALSRLEAVVAELLREGVAASTPAAIVARATLPDERLVTAELGRLVEVAQRVGVSTPALVLVGDVVLFRELKRFLPMLEARMASTVSGLCGERGL